MRYFVSMEIIFKSAGNTGTQEKIIIQIIFRTIIRKWTIYLIEFADVEIKRKLTETKTPSYWAAENTTQNIKSQQRNDIELDKKIILLPYSTQNRSEQYNFPCKEYGKKFGIKENLSTHLGIHRESASVRNDCGKTFKNVRYLQMHMKHVHYKPSFPCQLYRRFMATPESLDENVKQHHQKKRITCKQ